MTGKYEGEAFRERFGPWAVIAGGSDGIGAAFAENLASQGFNLVLIARDEAKLSAKRNALSALHSVEIRCLSTDLTSDRIGEVVAEATQDLEVGLLIYNAGSGRGMGSFLDRPAESWMRQVQLACSGPLALAHHFGQGMRERGRGGIVLMSSLSSLIGSAYTATYCAAKAFDTILAEGLWQELAPAGIDVVSCLAGMTDTETFREDTGGSDEAMDPADVAAGTLDFLGSGPHYVPGAGNRAGAAAVWPVPRIPLTNRLSAINAKSFDEPFVTAVGQEFSAD
ncbi:MAG: SDR family NAD(P)-dependent oxidoreductase [Myxococcota bacterium]